MAMPYDKQSDYPLLFNLNHFYPSGIKHSLFWEEVIPFAIGFTCIIEWQKTREEERKKYMISLNSHRIFWHRPL